MVSNPSSNYVLILVKKLLGPDKLTDRQVSKQTSNVIATYFAYIYEHSEY